MVKKTASAELAETLRVITAAAPGLRSAGVTHLQLGDLHVDIEPALLEAPKQRPAPELDADFLDPAKYRRAEGADEVDLADIEDAS